MNTLLSTSIVYYIQISSFKYRVVCLLLATMYYGGWKLIGQCGTVNTLPSTLELCAKLHSAKKMLPRVPSSTMDDSTFWHFLRQWAVTLFSGIYKGIFVQASELLRQLSPLKFVPLKSSTVEIWLLLSHNFTRFTIHKSLYWLCRRVHEH